MTGPISPQPAADSEFAEVYRAHFEYAWACLRRLGVPPEAQEDALQDLFLAVYRRLPAFAGRSSLKTWIFGVARKVAARHRRTEERRNRRHERLAAALEFAPAVVGEDDLSRREARRRLDSFLDALDDDKRAVFVLHIFEELSGPEIAESLGLKVNTVYSRLRLIREQFERTFAGSPRAALIAAREPERPPEGVQRRVWGAVVLHTGGGASLAAPGPELTPGVGAASDTLAGLPWALGLVGAAILVVATARAPSPPTSGVARSEAAAATTRREAITPPSLSAANESTAPIEVAAIEPPEGEPRRPRGSAAETAAPRRVVAPTNPAERAAPDPPSGADALAAETALMARVRAAVDALRSDEALGLLRQHAREFPDGVLQHERHGFRAIALCRGGRAIEGRGEAAAFLRDHPGTALAAQVRAACGPG